MKSYLTSITAIDPQSNKLVEYEGPTIEAINFMDAEKICRIKYPYASIIGQIIVKASYVDGQIKNVIDYNDVEKN